MNKSIVDQISQVRLVVDTRLGLDEVPVEAHAYDIEAPLVHEGHVLIRHVWKATIVVESKPVEQAHRAIVKVNKHPCVSIHTNACGLHL